MTCDDLRVGGELSSSGVSGGTSINSTALMVNNWAGLLGTPGISGSALTVNGRPGMFLAGDQLGRARFFNLSMKITRWGPDGFTLTEADENHQIWENTDDFLTLITEPETLLEIDLPDATSRFLRVTNLDPAYTTRHDRRRNINIPLVSDWPYWRQGGQEESDTINGADTLTVGGRKSVYDAKFVFAGDGTFTHDDLGWEIEVVNSAGPVTVDLSTSPVTITEGGTSATNRVRRNNRNWAWFTPGDNNVTTTVSVDLTRRPQFV